MTLMVLPRVRAASHILRHTFRGDHKIWRLYRWWGLDTHAVFCSCGKAFGLSDHGKAVLRQFSSLSGAVLRMQEVAKKSKGKGKWES